VIHSFATDVDDPAEDPRFGRVGRQTIEGTGPLTQERMKAFDSAEVIPRAEKFVQKANGVNNLPYWKGETDHSARNHIFY